MLKTTIELTYQSDVDKKVMRQVRIFIELLKSRDLKVTDRICTTGVK